MCRQLSLQQQSSFSCIMNSCAAASAATIIKISCIPHVVELSTQLLLQHYSIVFVSLFYRCLHKSGWSAFASYLYGIRIPAYWFAEIGFAHIWISDIWIGQHLSCSHLNWSTFELVTVELSHLNWSHLNWCVVVDVDSGNSVVKRPVQLRAVCLTTMNFCSIHDISVLFCEIACVYGEIVSDPDNWKWCWWTLCIDCCSSSCGNGVLNR